MAKIRTVPKVYIESEEIQKKEIYKKLQMQLKYMRKKQIANFYDLIKEKKMRK